MAMSFFTRLGVVGVLGCMILEQAQSEERPLVYHFVQPAASGGFPGGELSLSLKTNRRGTFIEVTTNTGKIWGRSNGDVLGYWSGTCLRVPKPPGDSVPCQKVIQQIEQLTSEIQNLQSDLNDWETRLWGAPQREARNPRAIEVLMNGESITDIPVRGGMFTRWISLWKEIWMLPELQPKDALALKWDRKRKEVVQKSLAGKRHLKVACEPNHQVPPTAYHCRSASLGNAVVPVVP